MARNHVCFNCRKVARAAQSTIAHCPQCREPMLCVGLVQPPPARRIKAWQTWRDNLENRKKSSQIRQAKIELRQQTKQHCYLEILENRTQNTLASRRRLRRASKAYDQL